MTMRLSPIANSAPFVDASGIPLNGGQLFTYVGGSVSTPQTTYTDSLGTVPHANPIILDSNGYPSSGGSVQEIWLTSGATYKFVLKNSVNVTVWSRDNISGINDTTLTIDQWVSGPTPTYTSATQFVLSGDQSTIFHVGRRVKTTNSGGTIYSTISAVSVVIGPIRTGITVENDSGVLDSGLSAVSYGLLSAVNPSSALLSDAYPIVSGSTDATKKVRLEVDGLTTATTRVITVPDSNITLGDVTATGFTTGDVKLTFKTAADSGWVLMNDTTIGDASSGATGRANADTSALFTLLWNNTVDADCAVSTGRGANAAADYAAHKTLALPKTLGRALASYGAGSGLTSRALAHVVGEETHALTIAELAAHTHNQQAHTAGSGLYTGNSFNATLVDTGIATTSTGSGTAHNTMQPTLFFNTMIKL